jgi:hypothetical protein
MPAVADVSTAPKAMAGASAAKKRKKMDAWFGEERHRGGAGAQRGKTEVRSGRFASASLSARRVPAPAGTLKCTRFAHVEETCLKRVPSG